MRYLLAKLYYWRACFSPDDDRAVNWLDQSHDLDPRADPHFNPDDYATPDLDPVGFIRARGWNVAYVPDEGPEAPPGWWAYKGRLFEPDIETGLFDTAEGAARAAMENFPAEFA